jgi:hypothetical protein
MAIQLGVTSTNVLVDVVDFFGQNVYADLQATPGSVNPILTVDAIKFLYTFRNQVRLKSWHILMLTRISSPRINWSRFCLCLSNI